MALAATVTEVWHDGQRMHVRGTIAASGSYVTGGDTLSFAIADLPAREGPLEVIIFGQAGFIYAFKPGTTILNGLMMVFVNTAGGVNTALGEHTAVAYVAGITGDTIRFHAIFKFGT